MQFLFDFADLFLDLTDRCLFLIHLGDWLSRNAIESFFELFSWFFVCIAALDVWDYLTSYLFGLLVVSDIESGNAHEESAKEFKETLDSITTQSIAQVDQKQTSVSQV
jgi:hypothetical protein